MRQPAKKKRVLYIKKRILSMQSCPTTNFRPSTRFTILSLSLFPLFCCLEKDLATINMGAQNCSLYGGIEMSRLILRMKHPTQNLLAMGGEAQDLICSDEGFKCLMWDFFILNNCNNTCLEYVYLQVGQ